jgi:predicted SnoaL-like aldol condensation-catalyzing enzyme
MKSTTISSHKAAATSFLQLAASGRVREAFDAYVAPSFRHHNPHFRGDARSLATAMEENARVNPEKVFEVRQSLEEGDLVAVHGRVRIKPSDTDIALVHIFRFEDDQIVELWDIGQPVPPDSPNEYGAF